MRTIPGKNDPVVDRSRDQPPKGTTATITQFTIHMANPRHTSCVVTPVQFDADSKVLFSYLCTVCTGGSLCRILDLQQNVVRIKKEAIFFSLTSLSSLSSFVPLSVILSLSFSFFLRKMKQTTRFPRHVRLLASLMLCYCCCWFLPTTKAFGVSSPQQQQRRRRIDLASSHQPDSSPNNNKNKETNRKTRLRNRVTNLVKTMMSKPISSLASPDAVRAVLSDATLTAVDMAVEDLQQRRREKMSDWMVRPEKSTAAVVAKDVAIPEFQALVRDTFQPLEDKLDQLEYAVQEARQAIEQAKETARLSLEAVQAATLEQAIEGAMLVVEQAEEEAGAKALADLYVAAVSAEDDVDVSTLAFEDVDYGTSEMAPPFLGDDQCLVVGEPVVRVEKAPENSRRIFAGIDIMASVEDVWNVLTDYRHLQDVVPNLVVNDVLEEYPAVERVVVDKSRPESEQCQQLAQQMKGSLLRQVGGAKIAGIQFSARTTLEVREWPQGLPDFAHFQDDVWEGKSRKQRANDLTTIPLERYKFPRPFAVSKLPTRDISMQSIENDDGEFRMYQGVWRMQPLPGCSPPGMQAMRLTYAVEVSPRAYLPVRMIEGRIVRDLCNNLIAIRNYLGSRTLAER